MSFLLTEHFGDEIPSVFPPKSKELKEKYFSCVSLRHHELVSLNMKLNLDNCLRKLRVPMYMSIIKDCQFNDMESEVVMELAVNHRCSISYLIQSLTSVSNDPLRAKSIESSIQSLITRSIVEQYSITADEELPEVQPVSLGSKRKLSSEVEASSPKKGFDSAFVRLNYNFLDDLIFLDFLAQIVRNTLNMSSSVVFKSVFINLFTRGDLNGRVSVHQVAQKLPGDTNLALANSDGRDKVFEYLRILSQDSKPFLRASADSNGGFFFLNWPFLNSFAKKHVINQFILDRFGSNCLRILRIVSDKQNVDEKIISKLALLNGKDVRESLYKMLKVGVVEIQEVPRTADRAAAKSFFLWKSSVTVAAKSINRLCSSMILNICRKKSSEIMLHQRLIDKMKRSDINGDSSKLGSSEAKLWDSFNSKIRFLTLTAINLERVRLALSDRHND